MQGQSDINVTPLIDVLVVLIAIFLVVSPVALNRETIEVPRRLGIACGAKGPDEWVLVKVRSDLSMTLDDRGTEEPVLATELARTLRPKLAETKVVFVDFAGGVRWADVVDTMDRIHGLASDIKVALATPSGALERADQ